MTAFKFEGMVIDRLIGHTIFARTESGSVPPNTSDHLLELDSDSKDLFQIRITGALASRSHGIEMEINKDDSVSFMQRAAAMMYSTDQHFIDHSKTLAEALTEAQTSRRWPGGVLIMISGKIGAPQKRFLVAMKAETDKGFNVEEVDGAISLKLIKKMLLSQTQKLYKVGMLVEVNHQSADQSGLYLPANYRAFLFDHLLRATETKSAAEYFYDAFLGMSIQGSSKQQTQLFYEASKNFIDTLDASPEVKYDLRESLRSELRSQKGTLQLQDFADEHIPDEYKDNYIAALTDAGFPSHAIVKDTHYISTKLKRPRRMLFSTGVKIDVPPQIDLGEHVKIKSQEGQYSIVHVKGVLEAQD